VHQFFESPQSRRELNAVLLALGLFNSMPFYPSKNGPHQKNLPDPPSIRLTALFAGLLSARSKGMGQAASRFSRSTNN